MDHPEAEAAVRERDDLVAASLPTGIAARVRDDDDLELETLRTVDGEKADSVRALLLGERLDLPGTERLLVVHEADERREIGAADRLVLPREPPQLPQVREAARTVPAREDRQVVVVLREDLLAKPLEPRARRHTNEPLVALQERAQELLLLDRDAFRQRALERGEERPLGRASAEQHERVVRDADERRRENGGERDVVVAVVQEAEVREQVRDLLLSEVAAARRAVRGEPEPAELLLVHLGVRARGEEDDDLARHRFSGVHELAHPPRDRTRLAATPVLPGVAVARLVGDEQLDGMAEDGVGELGRRGERLELVAERSCEEVVDRGEHLRPGAVVAPQAEQARRLLAATRGRPRRPHAGSRRSTGTRRRR